MRDILAGIKRPPNVDWDKLDKEEGLYLAIKALEKVDSKIRYKKTIVLNEYGKKLMDNISKNERKKK